MGKTLAEKAARWSLMAVAFVLAYIIVPKWVVLGLLAFAVALLFNRDWLIKLRQWNNQRRWWN